jgi:serine/threonine protein kinase
MRLTAGQLVDRYRVCESLGVGGMSEAYLACREPDGLRVVIKLPHPHLIGDPTTYTRFEREAEIGRRLTHENIQRVLEAGRLADGFAPYIVMEYVEGESLRTYLAAHAPLPVDQAIDFASQLAAALAYCHAQGVVHRDLKPENVLVTADGRLKLMDFGIALLQGARRVTWGSLSSAVGTPDYMAPEQVRGERGDERTDVYAVGVMLYEMLIGQVPYQGDSALSIMSQRVNRDPAPVGVVRPEVPTWLQAVVRRAQQRDPARRYPTMAALADDLAHPEQVDLAILADEDRGSTGLPSALVTWVVVAAMLLALVALGIAAQLVHQAQLAH